MSATSRTTVPALRLAVKCSSGNTLSTLLSTSSLQSSSSSSFPSSCSTKEAISVRYICNTTKPTMAKESGGLSYYLSSLRKSALEMLTSDLAPEERTNLLSRLNAVDASEAQKVEQKSIGEAVAEAVAKETQKNTSLWEKEKNILAQQAEKAAQERVMSDLAVQRRMLGLERWKKELQLQEEQEQKVKDQQQQQGENDTRVNGASAQSTNKTKEEQNVIDHDHHPILGEVILDLGYKRIYAASAKNLASIPVWERQRVYRHERAKVMATEKRKSLELGLPGIITLHEASNGQLSILDGQHRVGMMAILQSKISSSTAKTGNAADEALNLDRVLVEVFPDKNDSDSSTTATTNTSLASDVFTEINKAEPVKLVDMPGIAKKSDRRIIDDAASMLCESYPDMFKPSQRCRAPHLNVDNLRDALFAADVLQRHSIRSHHDLLVWIEEKNAEMRSIYASSGDDDNVDGASTTMKNVSKTALNKAIKFDFFLGLDSSWLYK
mmetsp:Transcript_1439/g.2124  ORF Transcript_1439/g.2124 Transcript_1439/m.2124 type:complete len:496 (+) Transcript_1439:179-1666(+)